MNTHEYIAHLPVDTASDKKTFFSSDALITTRMLQISKTDIFAYSSVGAITTQSLKYVFKTTSLKMQTDMVFVLSRIYYLPLILTDYKTA